MPSNFKLVAITKENNSFGLYRVRLDRNLQKFLKTSWQNQYDDFIENVNKINFDAGYTPEQHEIFQLTNYVLPPWLQEKTPETLRNLNSFADDESKLDATKGFVAFVENEQGEELMLFQNFNRSHIIRPGFSLFLTKDTYNTIEQPGISLGSKLNAVFLPDEKTLLFHSFRNANMFLPLAEFYKEASDSQILEILDHDRLDPENKNAHIEDANQWFRKRFAMLRDSKILDEYTPQEIVNRSQGYEVNIRLNDDGDRIVFPTDRIQAKRLLQFLNEEIFRGVITETLYETNSKREAD